MARTRVCRRPHHVYGTRQGQRWEGTEREREKTRERGKEALSTSSYFFLAATPLGVASPGWTPNFSFNLWLVSLRSWYFLAAAAGAGKKRASSHERKQQGQEKRQRRSPRVQRPSCSILLSGAASGAGFAFFNDAEEVLWRYRMPLVPCEEDA